MTSASVAASARGKSDSGTTRAGAWPPRGGDPVTRPVAQGRTGANPDPVV